MWRGVNKLIDFIDKTSTQSGTPLSRENLMAMQGFIAQTTKFNGNTITETNSKGQIKTTTFNTDGSITETFVGDKTITKKTTFDSSGNVTEVIS